MSKIKICLDAGHAGKYNQSPGVTAYYESDFNWNLHLLLKKYLEEYGIEVVLTRSEQKTDKGLKERGKAAKGCDVLLSIHSNSVDKGMNENVDYPLVIVPIDGSGTKLGENLAKCIETVMGTKEKAQTISKKGSGDWDYYSVIFGADSVGVPGIILEHSFYTNTKMAKWMLDEKNLDKLAKAEADVIANHFGVKKEVTKMVTVKLPVLKPGDKGEAVKAMQILLIDHGYPISAKGATGNYGNATKAALIEFKKAKGLKESESCGVQTWSALLGV